MARRVSATAGVAQATTASLPVVRALLDEAARKNFTGGVLGVQARAEWDGPAEFEHNGVNVRVMVCESALAVREALLDRDPQRWLVVLTDRDALELGLGITAHLIWQRLRHPDPWAAVQDRFSATRIDHRLVDPANGRDLANGLLNAAPASGWPPVRAGLLTSEHAYGCVAALRLGLGAVGDDLDLAGVLRWSTGANAATSVADLRAIAGDVLVTALLGWIAERCGTFAQAAGELLREGRAGDLIPLGLVARLVAAAAPASGPRALLGREIGGHLTDQALLAWAAEAEAVTRELVAAGSDSAARVLARAESLVDHVQGGSLAAESTVLRRGLTMRLADLGDALRRCTDRATVRAVAGGADAALANPELMGEIEGLRGRVVGHALAGLVHEVRVPRALAGVRLARWLSQPVSAAQDLGAQVIRHRDDDAWVDRAIADAWTGVEDETLAQGLRAVLAATRIRRDAHDQSFAAALAGATERNAEAPDGMYHLESLLAQTVLPLAKQGVRVLLVLADGMSHAVATEVVDDIVRRYESWQECLPSGRDRRISAIAVLPSLTKVCRASLFCGELTVGEQNVERTGFAALAKAHGVTGRLFHKLELDTSEAGFALAADVAGAIDDVRGTAVVACVLNTIDDALDRSDPGGTDWTADTVKHLRPLLDRARRAGRVVVLTSDHGHVVERRAGRLVSVAEASSNRSRPFAGGAPLDAGEVRVRGPRVLLHNGDHGGDHGGDAVLAVDEGLRYGPLKAGYHGGAAPAEVVVPVSVLTSGEPPTGWRFAPPQHPGWWRAPLSEPTLVERPMAPVLPAAVRPQPTRPRPASVNEAPTLFDEVPPETERTTVAEAVLASAAYREQRARAGRTAVTDAQMGRLLGALLSASGHRLDRESAAAALGVAVVQLAGAVSQARRLLNIEQYAVLSYDADGVTVVLDIELLREQFGVAWC